MRGAASPLARPLLPSLRSAGLHSGNGGDRIYLVPQYDLGVAITSTAYGKGYGQPDAHR